MAKRDYYEILGVTRTASDGELKAAYPQARDAVPPGPQSRRQGLRAPLQGNQRGLRRPEGRQKRAAYDRFGHAAFEQGGGRRRTASAPTSPRPSPTSSTTCSAWAAGAAARAAGPRARRGPALQHGDHARGGLRRQDRAGPHPDLGDLRGLLRAPAPRPAPSRRPARPAAARARCASPGLLHARAHLPGLPGPRPGDRGSRARPARARAASRASARCRSTCRPASRTAPASASPARARPACAAGRRATSTSSCRSRRTRSSSATAPTCIAACRSRW